MPLLRTHIVPHPPLIVPEVGSGRHIQIQSTVDAYQRVAESVAADKPDLIIFITPHGKVYDDYIHIAPGDKAEGDFSQFGAPHPRFSLEYDEPFITRLSVAADNMRIPAGTLGGRDKQPLDHGVMVPMYFINRQYNNYKAARISISGLPPETHYQFGQCIKATLDTMHRRAVIIASGDLSHKLTDDGPYGFAAEGPAFDEQVCIAMRESDFLRFMTFDPVFYEKAAECGLRSFIIMAGAMDGQDAEAEFMSYEGPFGVGYAVCSFTPGNENNERAYLPAYRSARDIALAERRAGEDAYVRLARETVETFVQTQRAIACPADLPDPMLLGRAGTFVSIKKDGKLRGCIGTTEAYRINIAEEIIGNAISAAAHDPRFDAITPDELPYLTYSVDILSPAEPIENADALDVLRYGVIVSNGAKRGLLLPNLEGIDTVDEQISIVLQKAGISASSSYSLSRFEVVRHA